MTRPVWWTILLCLTTSAAFSAEPAHTYPLWENQESVESYAKKVNLSSTKSIDLGNGVKLDLVLIPAGQFMMGSEEPAKPTVTVDQAAFLVIPGALLFLILFFAFLFRLKITHKFSFSLRWLFLMMLAIGAIIGGVVRDNIARAQRTQYETAMAIYSSLPANEKPAHSITFTQPFYMGKYTVTQEQYTALMGKDLRIVVKGALLPVHSITWDDAAPFCQKLNGLFDSDSLEIRLPNGTEWEYACRAGTRTLYFSGDSANDLNSVAWTRTNSGLTPHPAGQLKSNTFGLYDMHGNVWQWCQSDAHPKARSYKDDYVIDRRYVKWSL